MAACCGSVRYINHHFRGFIEGIPYHFDRKISRLKNFFSLLRGCGVPVGKNIPLEIRIVQRVCNVKTNYKGSFNLTLEGLISVTSCTHSSIHYARFHYISKSESNLFKLINVFISNYDLPKGVLVLTSYLNLRQLLKPKKGKDFKINRITSILERKGDKKFIFLGDDSQRDIEIFTDAVAKFPNRILKIYIHKTHDKSSQRQQRQLKKLMESDIPMLYFRRNDDVYGEIESLKTTLI